MISILLISMIEWLSVHRITSILRSKKVLDEKTKSFLQITALGLSFFPLLFQMSLLTSGLFCCAIVASTLSIPKIISFRRQQEFLKNRVFAVDVILLAIQTGKSFRQALLDIKSTEMNYGYYIHEIAGLVLLREDFILQFADPLALRFYQELKIFEGMSHKLADRIKSFREIMKLEEVFRQKSRMATLQARAQSIIVGILYFLAWIFNFAENEKEISAKIWISSLFLFVLGTIWIWKLGKTHRWMV
jgi:hypothetical protein